MTKKPLKIALVTGANRGLGFEMVRQLAEQGIHVFLSGRNAEKTMQAANKLKKLGLSVVPLKLDVTKKESISAAVAVIKKKYGYLDILINNAGIRIESYGKNPSQQPLKHWRKTFNTNLFGVVEVCIECLPLIMKSSAGRIVNVSSLLASLSTHCNPESYTYSPMFKSLPAYSASKSALNSWTIHLAYELRNTSIKVNAVHPGYTRTEMNEGKGDMDVSQGAKTSIKMALLDNNGPSGSYVHMDKDLMW